MSALLRRLFHTQLEISGPNRNEGTVVHDANEFTAACIPLVR